MLDLGPHALFIVVAYGVTFIAVGALALTTVEDDRQQRRKLAELERKGIRRRSAANPKPAAPAKKATAAKPSPANAKPTKLSPAMPPAKRKPGAARTRKPRA